MDIWAWYHERVEQLYKDGQHRLVEIMESISSLTVDGEHDKVDAMVPEGLALARSIKDPWLELFLRHWELQSLVLHRKDVKQGLPKAVSLLEFAHREENQDCPQSVCAVQDLANCYGHADGPGYVQERLDVASESMAKIDPTWPCYVCIATEYVTALIDSQQYDKALEFLGQCDKDMLAKRERKDTGYLLLARVNALTSMGRHEDAKKWLKKANSPSSGDTFELAVKLMGAKILAHLDQYESCLAALPEFQVALADPSIHIWWVETTYLLAKNGAMENDWILSVQHQKMIQAMINNGAVRDAITMCAWACELALLRQQAGSACYLIDIIKTCIPELHKVLDAEEILSRLIQDAKQLQQSLEKVVVPEKLEEVQEWLGDDPEIALTRLEACRDKWPEAEVLVVEVSRHLLSLGRSHVSIKLLQDYLQEYPDSETVILELGYALSRDQQAFMRFYNHTSAQELGQESHLNLLWVKALCHRQHAQPDEAKACLIQILEAQPELYNTRQLLARIEQEQGNYQEALAHIKHLMENYPDKKDLNWDVAVLATLLQDWDSLRTCAASLDMELEGDGPEYGRWGYCRLQFEHEDGEKTIIYADRVGPVTARVSHASHIGKPQLYNNLVVFDPAPLNQLDQEDDEGRRTDKEGYDSYLYPVIKTIEPGAYRTFALDGIDPGEDKVQQLVDALKQQDCLFNRRNGDDYKVYDEQEDKESNGLYGYMLVPESTRLTELNQVLESLIGEFDHPLMWMELAQVIGDEQLIKSQQAIQARYCL